MQEASPYFSPPTFRDPAGSVEVRPDGVYRTVRESFAADCLAFLATPLHAEAVERRQLVASDVVSGGAPDEALLVRHPRIAFPSYPFEWSASLWLSAAELTLSFCAELVSEGWILKDATPRNVLFQGVSPIFVDLSSIQRLDARYPLWYAYGQFVRTFLLPMVAHSQLGWPLGTTLLRRDGFEPEELYRAFSWAGKMSRPAFASITLPTLLSGVSRKHSSQVTTRTSGDPELTRSILQGTLRKLRKNVVRAMPSSRTSTWSSYTATATHYSDDDHADKHAFVSKVLESVHPRHLLDVGCNTGVYSMLAADLGAEVISIDSDHEAVDRLSHAARKMEKNIHPLCVDFAHPTPATGWENRETMSFLERCEGHFDTVMMLAVLHHLLLSNQIPLSHIASLCSRVTTTYLIIEWVPPTDPKFVEILRGREEIYQHIQEQAFRSAFEEYFTTEEEKLLRNGRIVLLMRKK